MNACAMIARCHRHQWPQAYGQPAQPLVEAQMVSELLAMWYRGFEATDSVMTEYDS
jgi:hypothetical protein